MKKLVVTVSEISKQYEVFDGSFSRLANSLFPAYKRGITTLQALDDVSFEVSQGESVGLIGENGSGKSSLLQILAGTLTQSSGTHKVTGRISALLELGSGFDPNFTGRDNILMNGLLLGISREDILSRFGEIEDFAEIGGAIDRPVKTYSTGMAMRLAFAVQVLTEPDILIVDEALSVGDFFFQQKCLARIRQLQAKGMTLIIVSHDMGLVRSICDRGILLDEGRVRFDGAVTEAVALYFNKQDKLDSEYSERKKAADSFFSISEASWTSPRASSARASICSVTITDSVGEERLTFKIGETMNVTVDFYTDETRSIHVSINLFDRNKTLITCTGSRQLGLSPISLSKPRKCRFSIGVTMLVEAGQYSLDLELVSADQANTGHRLDGTPMLGPIVVHWDYENVTAPFTGMVGLPCRAELEPIKQVDA